MATEYVEAEQERERRIGLRNRRARTTYLNRIETAGVRYLDATYGIADDDPNRQTLWDAHRHEQEAARNERLFTMERTGNQL